MIQVSNQLKNVEVVEQPSLCPRMIVESERIIGQCDDVEAIKQAIYNILNPGGGNDHGGTSLYHNG